MRLEYLILCKYNIILFIRLYHIDVPILLEERSGKIQPLVLNSLKYSEGTYIADIIVPVIQATLKDLPIGKSAYVST